MDAAVGEVLTTLSVAVSEMCTCGEPEKITEKKKEATSYDETKLAGTKNGEPKPQKQQQGTSIFHYARRDKVGGKQWRRAAGWAPIVGALFVGGES